MIVVRFSGGFANQLFIYAFYLHLKEKFSSSDIFADISHYKTCHDHGGFKLNRFVKLDVSNRKNFNGFITVDENNYDDFVNNYSENNNYFFNSYWQEDRFFPNDLSSVRDIFLSEKCLPKNAEYLKKIRNTNSVSVHVRCGDYVNNFMHGNIASECYLQNSIDYIKDKIENPHFFVFSDDIKWAQNNLRFDGASATFVTGNLDDVEQDIILMSNCKHNIISNSSFSWWAQFLNSNPEKIVITPEYWFNQPTGNVKELFVENAVKIPNTPSVLEKCSEPFFSILIPVYNTSATLRRTLASVLNQNFTNIEVIVVDDGSKDDSFEILQSYENRDKRVNFIKHEKNSGLLAARYTAMKEASGKYVMFLDSDDWLELDTYQVLYDELQKNPVDILEFGYIREPEKLNSDIVHNTENRVEKILQDKYPGTLWNKAYSINIIKKGYDVITPFKATFAEDYFFSIVFATFAKSIGYLDEVLHHYMFGTGITTQSLIQKEKLVNILSDLKNVNENIISFLNSYNPNCADYVPNFMQNTYNYLVYLISMDDSVINRIELLKLMDCSLSTKYADNLLCDIVEKSQKYDRFMNSRFISQIKQAVVFFIRRIVRELKTYLVLLKK